MVAFLRRVDPGDDAMVREWLLAPLPSGELAFDLLAGKRYDELAPPFAPATHQKRPSPISAEASARRRPPRPAELLKGDDPSGRGEVRRGKGASHKRTGETD